MRNITTLLRSAAAAGVLALIGCGQTGSVVANPTERTVEVEDPAALYDFVEHAAPAQGSESAFAPNADLRCARTCVSEWSRVEAECSVLGAAGCRADANVAVVACLETSCYEQPDSGPSSCTTQCANEASLASSACEGDHCDTEASDVYAVCFDADCRDPGLSGRIVRRLSDCLVELQDADEPTAAEGPAGFDCEAACQAFEVQSYLNCVDEHTTDGTVCRDRSGATYDSCMQSHCPNP